MPICYSLLDFAEKLLNIKEKRQITLYILFDFSPLSNQFGQSDLDLSIQRIAGQVLAILLVAVLAMVGIDHLSPSNPYVQSVLSLEGDRDKGYAIFQMNCAGCHGSEANGHVGPSLRGVAERKSPADLIQQVISGETPPMPQFQPSPEVMADLLNYLKTL
jgi:mono/diheme cytochrome c family protein